MGLEAFRRNGNKRYTKEFKEQAVADYLSGKGSLLEICKKYKIKSTYQLRNWININVNIEMYIFAHLRIYKTDYSSS